MSKLKISIAVFVVALFSFITYNIVNVNANKNERNIKYYSISDGIKIIPKGPSGAFDSERTHTLSIVEMNKGGYKYWGYYHGYDGKNIRNDVGLAYSNDLVNWVKESEKPIVPNMRWASSVVVDGTVYLFGTRNYGDDSYLVKMSSKDGKNFSNEEVVVPSVQNEKNQNGFIFFDQNTGMYRLYYYHNQNGVYFIEEKHSEDINTLKDAKPVKILSDKQFILAAPSVMYRDGKYWLAAETLHEVKGKKVWKTIVFASKYPTKGFVPADNHEILINSDACYFQYIFDNKLAGVYSHEYSDGTWEMYLSTHEFENKVKIEANYKNLTLKKGELKNLIINVTGSSNREITDKTMFASSDNEVINIKSGKIQGLKPGNAIITASYEGTSITIPVEVTK